jgi:hypothetical protein
LPSVSTSVTDITTPQLLQTIRFIGGGGGFSEDSFDLAFAVAARCSAMRALFASAAAASFLALSAAFAAVSASCLAFSAACSASISFFASATACSTTALVCAALSSLEGFGEQAVITAIVASATSVEAKTDFVWLEIDRFFKSFPSVDWFQFGQQQGSDMKNIK